MWVLQMKLGSSGLRDKQVYLLSHLASLSLSVSLSRLRPIKRLLSASARDSLEGSQHSWPQKLSPLCPCSPHYLMQPVTEAVICSNNHIHIRANSPSNWKMFFLENMPVSAQITFQWDLAKNDFRKGLGRQTAPLVKCSLI